jgi:hypothetical protein
MKIEWSDQEIRNTIVNMTDTKSLFSMTGYSSKQSPYKSRREEIIADLVKGINQSRIGTKYKPITEKWLSIRINRNPFLTGDTGTQELGFIKKECERIGNYKRLFWCIK